MDKFRHFLTELSARDTIMAGYYSLTFLLAIFVTFAKMAAIATLLKIYIEPRLLNRESNRLNMAATVAILKIYFDFLFLLNGKAC